MALMAGLGACASICRCGGHLFVVQHTVSNITDAIEYNSDEADASHSQLPTDVQTISPDPSHSIVLVCLLQSLIQKSLLYLYGCVLCRYQPVDANPRKVPPIHRRYDCNKPCVFWSPNPYNIWIGNQAIGAHDGGVRDSPPSPPCLCLFQYPRVCIHPCTQKRRVCRTL